MSHPVSSTTEQSQHETLILLTSYPDSQRKDYFGTPLTRFAAPSVPPIKAQGGGVSHAVSQPISAHLSHVSWPHRVLQLRPSGAARMRPQAH
eukprot:3638303-Pyramimonas_sp.AAC.1